MMLRSLLPATLALLLLPSIAVAAPDAPAGGSERSASAAPDSADRSRKSGSAKRATKRGSKSGQKSGGQKGSDGGRQKGSDGGGQQGSDGGERGPSGRPAPRDGGGDGDTAGSRGGSGPSARPGAARPAPADRGGSDASPGPDASPRGDTSRARPDAARPSSGFDGRGGFDGARPAPGQPTVRRVSVGTPASLTMRQPEVGGVSARSAAPSNFRSSADMRASANRAAVSRGADRPDGGHASAARHGDGGSDAVRATHGASAARHHEAARHARTTAAHHRHAAAYHRSAAARHHAWASARHHRYHRWYHPGGWFRPWRPGHAYWYHGVFVYGPSPWHHHHTVIVEGDGGGGGESAEANAPVRKVDRTRTFAVGLRGGSYMGGYNFGGGGFGDAGLGIAARYRPVEAVGLEVSWMHHDQTWDDGSERVYQPLQASVELFAAPWTRVNPYVLAGVTVTGREVEDNVGFTTVTQSSTLWGPHAGLGIEFGVGQKASINFDARYTGYLNKPADDLTIPGAFQGNMGLNFYF